MPKGMTSAQYMRERRAEFRARGGCAECGRPTLPGRTKCKEHALYRAAWEEKTRDARIAAGLCVACGKRPPKEGRRQCEECIERDSARGKKWRERQKEKRQCTKA